MCVCVWLDRRECSFHLKALCEHRELVGKRTRELEMTGAIALGGGYLRDIENSGRQNNVGVAS